MIDYLDSTDVTLHVTLQKQNEPSIPDVGTLTYSVRDQDGALIPDLTDVEVVTTPTTFQVTIVIPAINNTVSASRRFEKRTVQFDYLRNGISHRHVETYRLIGFLNHSVTPGSVRAYLGVQSHELPDDEIDIFAAYLSVEREVGLALLTSALASGTTVELSANLCIRLQAVLDVLPSLKQRIAQSETNGLKGFNRPVVRDFSQLENNARIQLGEALAEITNRIAVDPTLVVLTQDVDPITG